MRLLASRSARSRFWSQFILMLFALGLATPMVASGEWLIMLKAYRSGFRSWEETSQTTLHLWGMSSCYVETPDTTSCANVLPHVLACAAPLPSDTAGALNPSCRRSRLAAIVAGEVAWNAGRRDDALVHWRTLPSFGEAMILRGLERWNYGDAMGARWFLDTALAEADSLQLHPAQRVRALDARSTLYMREERWEEAIDLTTRAIELAPNRADLRLRLAIAYRRSGRLSASRQTLHDMLIPQDLEPAWRLAALEQLALTQIAERDYPAATGSLEEARHLSRTLPSVDPSIPERIDRHFARIARLQAQDQ